MNIPILPKEYINRIQVNQFNSSTKFTKSEQDGKERLLLPLPRYQ